jgi:hypothetical protein
MSFRGEPNHSDSRTSPTSLIIRFRYVAGTAWSLANWITFQPLIDNVQESDASSGSRRATDTFAKILFAIFLCFAILSFEKFAIQFIAGKFHEKSYAGASPAFKLTSRTLITQTSGKKH